MSPATHRMTCTMTCTMTPHDIICHLPHDMHMPISFPVSRCERHYTNVVLHLYHNSVSSHVYTATNMYTPYTKRYQQHMRCNIVEIEPHVHHATQPTLYHESVRITVKGWFIQCADRHTSMCRQTHMIHSMYRYIHTWIPRTWPYTMNPSSTSKRAGWAAYYACTHHLYACTHHVYACTSSRAGWVAYYACTPAFSRPLSPTTTTLIPHAHIVPKVPRNALSLNVCGTCRRVGV